MQRKLYTITVGGEHREMLANSYSQVIAWAEQNLEAINSGHPLTITINSNVIDLLDAPQKAPLPNPKGPAQATPPPAAPKAPMAKKAATVKQAPGQVPEGMVLLSTLASEYGCSTVNIRQMLRRRGVGWERLAGVHGNPGAVDMEAARQALDAPRSKGGRPKAEKRDPRSGSPKPSKAELRKLEQVADKAKPAAVSASSGPRMVFEDKVAKQLGMTVDQVREVKRDGKVGGGNGWVNMDELEAYMASPEYQPPFTAN
ncbi:MAG: hypothetical protein JNL05_10455 [Flavobacteriales bacterium]|nr:hypothetical protein [Flavobacteriales bacterium]